MDSITDSVDMSLIKLWERVKDREDAWCASVHGVTKRQTHLSIHAINRKKINKTKSWFFEKIYKIDTPLSGHIEKKEDTNY